MVGTLGPVPRILLTSTSSLFFRLGKITSGLKCHLKYRGKKRQKKKVKNITSVICKSFRIYKETPKAGT